MANLNGVNVVIPAQAERISYNGAEYIRSEEKAAAGDVIRIGDVGLSFLTDNGYYEVTRIDYVGDAQIVDDDGDEYDTVALDEDFAVFKRVEDAQMPEPIADFPSKLPQEYVIHDGAVYVKEQRKANVGETVVVMNAKYDCFTEGEMLKVRDYDTWNSSDQYCVGRKYLLAQEDSAVLTPATSVTINGADYTLEKRKAAVGENVLIVHVASEGCYEIGDIRPIIRLNGTGDCPVIRTETVGDLLLYPREYVVLVPKKVAQPTQPSPQYREVRRKANVGERIRIVAATMTGGLYENGSELTIKRVDSDGDAYVEINGRRRLVYLREYVVLEPVASVEKPLAVGDYAKVIGGTNSGTKNGDIVRLTGASSGSGFYISDVCGNKISGSKLVDNLVRATDEEVAAAKAEAERLQREASEAAERKKAEEQRLKVGEYARVLADYKDVEKGDIVRIEADDRTGVPFKGVKVNGKPGEWDWFRPEQLERATEEEAKWAAIGRKVGEIKAGDVVKCLHSYYGHDVGTIGKVVEQPSEWSGGRRIAVLANGRVKDHTSGVELIAPVESLFTQQ